MNSILKTVTSIQTIASAYELIRKDPLPRLHRGSYVFTAMDCISVASALLGMNRNLVIHDYSSLEFMSDKIVDFTLELFNAPDDSDPFGTLTVGSSEAIMLALLCYCYPIRQKGRVPNIIVPSTVHACVPKFAKFFGVELRMVPVDPIQMTADIDMLMAKVDGNTGCVLALLGSTYTGHIDNINELNNRLLLLKQQTGLDISIAVDAAIGGYMVPFANPDLLWDMRLEQVRSISTSNHKFGLVSAGLGTLVFRDKKYVPEDLIFDINYLGKVQKNFSLNFSRNSSSVIHMYCNLLRYGFTGYKKLALKQLQKAEYLKAMLIQTNLIELVNNESYIPAVYFKAKPGSNFDLDKFKSALAKKGHIIPVYAVPTDGKPETISRMVVRSDFTEDMAKQIYKIAIDV